MKLTSARQKEAARAFAQAWAGRGDEKQDTQSFWSELLREVYGIDSPTRFMQFEKRVKFGGTTKFIDGYIPETRVLIEQKGAKIDLSKKEEQSDGAPLTPYEQGKRYADWLPMSERPRWIVACNFSEFEIHDQEAPDAEPIRISLADLPRAYGSLSFLTDLNEHARQAELDLSVKAAGLIAKLYAALLPLYGNGRQDEPQVLKSLNKLCVRLVFCLYAEDAGLFPQKDQFARFLESYRPENAGMALEKLFAVLNTPAGKRRPSLEPKLAAFSYVNGGLFARDEEDEIPPFDQAAYDILLHECSEQFNWSEISPTIFGAMFESTLNPETRRRGGMHYTSIENIHKVIDPLFLDSLKDELAAIKKEIGIRSGMADAGASGIKTVITRKYADMLRTYQDKLAGLKFLDPACGSGNFLTETYICLRRLENEALNLLGGGTLDLFTGQRELSPVKVSISQFHGIEINDFAVSVAKTALWIAESQMLDETAKIVGHHIDFLPLKTYTSIREGNALRTDWNSVLPASECSCIMGNPPFVGASMMNSEQKSEAVEIFGKIKLSNSIDYVGAWYYIAADYMEGTGIRAALVSTNSITQGEIVGAMWTPLFERHPGFNILFAYRTFIWDSEASEKAHVHCVIIGFSDSRQDCAKRIYDGEKCHEAANISPYLIDSPNVMVTSRSKPICDVPKMTMGNKPSDGGNLIIKDEATKEEICAREPNIEKYIRKYVGAEDYLHDNARRFCFWLVSANPKDIANSRELTTRLSRVREMRLKSTAKPTVQKAETPGLFFSIVQPDTDYLIIPRVSSERRRYIPIGFVSPDVIAADSCSIVGGVGLFHFGILSSSTHMAWVRTVAGRLKSDYRYSGSIVYNTFVWPEATAEQIRRIEATAQGILDARALYKDSSLADLYNDVAMPPELRKAHKANDKAVLEAYGLRADTPEPEIVAHLFRLYEERLSAANGSAGA